MKGLLAIFVRGAGAALTLSACNALFDIEEGTLVNAGGTGLGGGSGLPPFGAGASPAAGAGGQGGLEGAGGSSRGILRTSDVALTIAGADVSHPLGITGQLLTVKSPLGSVIDPDCEVDSTCFEDQTEAEGCAAGSTERVTDDDYANYWGANLQINLNPPWDRAGDQVKGIAFRIWGPALPRMRFQVVTTPSGGVQYPSYCMEWQPSDGETVEVLFDTLSSNCFDTTQAPLPLGPGEPLVTFAWQVHAEALVAKRFDFCISDLYPILGPAE